MSIPKVGHGHEPNPVSGSRLRLSPTSRVSLLHLKDTNDKAVGRWRDEYAPNSAKDREHNLLKLSVWNPCARSRLTFRAQARGTKTREPRSGTEAAIPRCLQRLVRHQARFFKLHNPKMLNARAMITQTTSGIYICQPSNCIPR